MNPACHLGELFNLNLIKIKEQCQWTRVSVVNFTFNLRLLFGEGRVCLGSRT